MDYQVGDIVDWKAPDGDIERLQIKRINKDTECVYFADDNGLLTFSEMMDECTLVKRADKVEPPKSRLEELKGSFYWDYRDSALMEIAEVDAREDFYSAAEIQEAREIILYRMKNPEPTPKHADVQKALDNYPNRWA